MPSQKSVMYFRGFEIVNCRHKSAKKDVKLLDNVSQLVNFFCLQKTITFLIHRHCTVAIIILSSSGCQDK